MSEKLLPCPLCGGCPVLTEAMTEHWVSCGTCGASGGMHGRLKLAIAAWNRRTPAPEGEVVCSGCEGRPVFPNVPCAVCGASPVVPVGVSEADINELRVVCDTNQAATDDSRIVRADDLTIGVIRRILAALRPTDTGEDHD